MLNAPIGKLKPQLCKEHPDEYLSFLCYDDQCKKRGPICAECQLFDHNKHNAKPLAIALKQISRDLQPLPMTLSFMVKLDSYRLKFSASISRFGHHRNELENEVTKLFKSTSEKIAQYRTLCSKIVAFQEIGTEFNRWIQKYRFYQKQEEDLHISNYQIFLLDLVKQIEMRSNQFEEAIIRRDDLHELLKLLAPIENETKVNYFFSPSLHHAHITVQPDGLTITQLNNYSTNFAFIQPVVQGIRKVSSKKSIKILINKLNSWLSVGAAYLSFAKKSNFYFNTGAVGHGGYMVSYNSYSWHHTDSNLNSNYIHPFAFSQGDIVTITINPASQKILFQKEGIKPYQLPYDRLPGEQLYFCVSLCSHEQSVTLVK